MTTAPLNTVRY